MQSQMRHLLWIGLITLAACTAVQRPDDAQLQREAMAGTEHAAPLPLPATGSAADAEMPTTSSDSRAGSGVYVHVQAPRKQPAMSGPGVSFNFEAQPIQTVVKAILGDLLKQNYSIVPGVQGQVSFATSQPVAPSQALPILENLLSWTGNALVHQQDRYVVMPAAAAVAGQLVPSLGAQAPAAGLQARLFPLHYVSATAMQKLLKPFAREDATLLADPARNVLVMAGTPQELRNYQQTIATFDVDWLRGSSVGVFSLDQVQVGELIDPINAMFGPNGDTPLAGMFRFIPIERSNALVVITTQPRYLQEIGEWIAKMDRGGGNTPQLYVYSMRHVQAAEMAAYLGAIYGQGDQASTSTPRPRGQVAPGLASATLGSISPGTTAGAGGLEGLSSNLGAAAAAGSGSTRTAQANGFDRGTEQGLRDNSALSDGAELHLADGIRIAAAASSNQLLVRARPAQWHEIEAALSRLDVSPMQVQVEARILEVSLQNEFSLGVQWYLEGLAGASSGEGSSSSSLVPGDARNHQQGAVGGGGNRLGSGDAFYYSFLTHNLQVAIHAMESSGKTKVLSAPSVVVINNQTANFQVGEEVPINTTSLNINSNADNVVNNATYIPTGVLLTVQPRVNPQGLVYMNIQQQVSSVLESSVNAQGNPIISQRAINTQVAVQSGQTVLLGGLIQQQEADQREAMPWLGRIPGLGYLFGTRRRSRDRTEIIVLLTPRVIRNNEEAKTISDEYRQRFQSLQPLPTARRGHAAPP